MLSVSSDPGPNSFWTEALKSKGVGKLFEVVFSTIGQKTLWSNGNKKRELEQGSRDLSPHFEILFNTLHFYKWYYYYYFFFYHLW